MNINQQLLEKLLDRCFTVKLDECEIVEKAVSNELSNIRKLINELLEGFTLQSKTLVRNQEINALFEKNEQLSEELSELMTSRICQFSHATDVSQRSASLNTSLLAQCDQSLNAGDQSASTTELKRTQHVELARLTECSRLSLLLDTKLESVTAGLEAQLHWLTTSSSTGVIDEIAPDETEENDLNCVQQICINLAGELSAYSHLDTEQAKADRRQKRQKDVLRRNSTVIDVLSWQTSCFELLTDLLELEEQHCCQSCDLLCETSDLVERLFNITYELHSRLLPACPKSTDKIRELLHHSSVSRFDDTFARLLKVTSLQNILDTASCSGSLDTSLKAFQHMQQEVLRDEQKIATKLPDVDRWLRSSCDRLNAFRLKVEKDGAVPQKRVHFNAAESTGTFPCSTHVNKVSADRLKASSAGLSDAERTKQLVTFCEQLNQLDERLQQLNLSVQCAFYAETLSGN